MSNETPITVVGNLTSDPELRFTQSGAAVTGFTVASTPKKFNKQTSQFEDGETLFMRCSVWQEQAENAAESLARGQRVVVTGVLVSRSWEDKETGQKRTVMEMKADEVAPSLRWATAKVTKSQRQAGGQSGGWGGAPQQAAQSDPWGQPPAQSGGEWGGTNNGATPPPF